MDPGKHDGPSWLVVMAASAGGIKAMGTILGALPADLPAAIIVAQHRPPRVKSHLEQILMRHAGVLTGTGMDATDGVQQVKAHGGRVIVQDRATSEFWNMPQAALRSGAVDYVLPIEAIGPAIDAIVHGRSVAGGVAATGQSRQIARSARRGDSAKTG